ncbi:hypothetical protein [Stenotrophomonas sp. MMGLT7]|uniref:hypothetical protein n=1 Tax=Stenotrophomonas sp. MMGLT7 TaxID=2901227 RepID=UPI001E578E3A|nr:hypothetical protein [Stenotrophomonas sp. MMGLT7]MCD7099393.1 hypothetical protein [Stenotrophomonas sp. MMGLT7]
MLMNGIWRFLRIAILAIFVMMPLGVTYAGAIYSEGDRVVAAPQLKIDFPVRGSLIRFFYSKSDGRDPDIEMYISTAADAERNMRFLGKIEPEGGAAQIESVFTRDVDSDGQKELFVIARWEVSHPGLRTSGNFYRTYVYKTSANGNSFSRMEQVERVIGSGMDGVREGRKVHYPYRDAGSIKKLLDKTRIRP